VFFIFIPFWGHKNGVHVGNDPAAFFLNYFHFSPTLPISLAASLKTLDKVLGVLGLELIVVSKKD